MGLLRRFAPLAAGVGLAGAALFAGEQIAERLGVRGGAGFIGRRTAENQQRAAAGLPPRRRSKRLMITKTEQRAMRSLKSKLKRISKAISPMGFKVVRKVPMHGHKTVTRRVTRRR